MDIQREIELFEEWLKTHALPPLAQLLWYKLLILSQHASSDGWFSISNRELIHTVQISEKTLLEMRNKLKEAGLIDFVIGRKGEPTRYRLNSFINCHLNESQPKDSLDISSGNLQWKNTVENSSVSLQGNFAVKNYMELSNKNSEKAEKQASEQLAPKPQNQSPQNDKDVNIKDIYIFDINNNNTNTLNDNQDNLEILKDNKLTNVNTEAGLKEQETTGKGDNESFPEVTDRQLIVELVRQFEQIIGKHDNKHFPLIGKLYNDYGYAEVLWALDRLEWALKNKKVEKPKGYLINVLKNSNDKKKESEADGKRKKDNRKYGELPPDDPYSIIKPIRLGKQPDPDVDPYASLPVIRLGPSSTA
ncbi:hypothetical protein B0S90_2828 [Caldicellulosiruptor bescii]|uniref:Primosome, DnaD subunit n=3 Tax=Caldicellulosiruptor bescii TaxID=31899 RepID=B9MNZ4_CALBD|nr:hypothetical protein [Caldicellulosiruptor bescii]ACM61553.1 hypothetical protein Athe_2485 [Caldicellulosiruptor bescii DSM 6725]PBC88635.1 hypothetical protein B0S87_1663 [Caldicellulosiruptor bescii]PBC91884.1 hypothetical protein B0S89_2330 [Caldicellulosiruptor bescii]PBD02705.1 hypothetical protein B0S85_0244 [Caldicellulosiruptor bescii]PBD07678.1 hypothetical protein B0S90_2828 [Caldicellulosiruptor bescii]